MCVVEGKKLQQEQVRSGKTVKYEVAGTNMNITQYLLSFSFSSNMLSVFFLFPIPFI